MPEDILFLEKLSSRWTEALFLALTAIFLLLAAWRLNGSGLDALAVVLLIFGAIFLFYSINYRVLVIRLTRQILTLNFGIFTWKVPLENIAACRLDDQLPFLMKYGGAGIHFMMVDQRYRASFNFLEYPRLVVAFKGKMGPVCDISFSTRHPQEILRLIENTTEKEQIPAV
ncbi:MAG: hypothetical protein MUC85_05160 [Anaerolineales bacterium]|jgi:hypothetical protein|nr:hypothetical protein [Anaerolineales bacterium]